MKGQILVVDPDIVAASRLRNDLYARGYVVHTARRGDDALSLLSRHRIAALVVKPDLPRYGIRWLYAHVSARHPHLKDRLIFLIDDAVSDDAKSFVRETGRATVASALGGAAIDETLSRPASR
jgi:DNA-binding response OmpR family regulator